MRFFRDHRKVNMALLLLGCFGGFVSLYLWNFHVNNSEIVCFTGCESVLSSDYGMFFGVPIAAYGFAYYIGILLIVFIRLQIRHLLFDRMLGLLLLWGLAYSIYLRYLEFFVLFDICTWCWASFVLIITMSILYWMEARDRFREIINLNGRKS